MQCSAKPRSWLRVDQLLGGRLGVARGSRARRTDTRARTRAARPAIASRQTPWKPSQPAITSQRSSTSSPSWVKRTSGRARASTDDVGDLEQQRQLRLQPRGDQVLDDLLLAVDGDRLARRSARSKSIRWPLPPKRSSMPSWTIPSRCRRSATPASSQQSTVRCSSTPGAHALLDVLARARLEHDRVDPAQLEQPREHEPRRPGADDPDLRLHHVLPSSVRAREAGSPGASSSTLIAASTISADGPASGRVVHGAEQPRPGGRDDVADAQRHRGQRGHRGRVAAAAQHRQDQPEPERAALPDARARRSTARAASTASSSPSTPATCSPHDPPQQADLVAAAAPRAPARRTPARAGRARSAPAARPPRRREKPSSSSTVGIQLSPA